jgi:hypothetical protein
MQILQDTIDTVIPTRRVDGQDERQVADQGRD